MKDTKGEKIFYIMNYLILTIVTFITLYPFIYVFSSSISSPFMVKTGKVLLIPKEITFEAYEHVLSQKGIWLAYANTVFYTVVGTGVNLLFTILGAYPLSKKRLMGRSFISFMIVFTMWFQAGMIPFYLNLRSLQLLNTRTAIIIAFAVATFYVIIMRTFFQSIPGSLEEAAKVDGANDFQILYMIYLPLSKPALAAIGLFYAVSRWNGYFWSMIILRDESKIPLQVLLKKLIVELSVDQKLMTSIDVVTYSRETVIYTTIVVAILPIILVYPFLQKYFTKGVMLGSIKG